MKKQYSILWLMAMAVAATLTFTACSDDDDNKAPDTLETTTYDDLGYFQRAIVDVDSLGNFLCRQYGTPLYDNDTTHLYIGVESTEAAEKIFRYWLAPDIEAAAAADGSITATLTDEASKAQGTVFFRPGTAGTVAEVTASPETRLLHFSQVTFLLNSAWPFNSATSKWHVGDVVHNVHLSSDIESKFDSGDVPRDWVCVRESGGTFSTLGITCGIPPMFCAITKQTYRVPISNFYNSGNIKLSKYCPSLPTADAIKDILTKDWDFFAACFAESGNGVLTGGDGYWIDDFHWNWTGTGYTEVYYYNSGFHYGENSYSSSKKPFLLKIDWVVDGEMHDGGTY